MNKEWSPKSWRDFPVKQLPKYPDPLALEEVEKQLSTFLPLVFAGEIRTLKQHLGDVCEGRRFLLQGGDCAESFAEHNSNNVRDTFRVLLQMFAILTFSKKTPIVKVGRIAGQFAKPRSADTEIKNGIELPSYRGDIINSIEFDKKARIPDPQRQISAYRQAASTVNLLRAFAKGGYADIRQVHRWNQDFIANSPQGKRYESLANQIEEALAFMKACGIDNQSALQLNEVDFFISHEALLLGYEEALTRIDSTQGGYYATSAHMLWVGDRTRQPEGAHIEFLSGIKNPLGIKCGPSLPPEELIVLLNKLNPHNEAGRVTLITRFGHEKIEEYLPKLIHIIKNEGHKVVWSCDPMHGNTIKTDAGYKTRPLDNIMQELQKFMDIHKVEGTYAGGIHLELTGQNVTECIGGAQEISEKDLSTRYHTYCDPRLNGSQALELAFLISKTLRE